MTKDTKCECLGGSKLLFACSGAADVGKIADLVARKLTADGVGKMFCLAGIGGRVDPIMKATGEASEIVAIDGCTLDCVKKTLENAGFTDLIAVRVTDMGYEKGKSLATDAAVADVATKTRLRLEV